MMKKIFAFAGICFLLMTLCNEHVYAQRRRPNKKAAEKETVSIYDIDTLTQQIPLQRRYMHDKIDHEQKKADWSDGAGDGVIYYSEDTVLTAVVTKAILTDVDKLQIMVENAPANGRDPFTTHQLKLRMLTAIYEMLQRYNADTHVDPYKYKKMVADMRGLLIAVNENRVLDFVKNNSNMYTLENGKSLLKEYPDARAYVYIQVGKQDPKTMIYRLSEFVNDTFADDIIKDAARVVPSAVFNFASSTNPPLRAAVRRSNDPLVQTIVKIADRSNSPLKALPFLGDIYNGKKTIAEVDAITANPDLYYQNLVRLKLENDTLGRDTYTEELAYRGLKYVRDMDDLHESPDAVRFKGIEGMSPEALYFIMVYGQDEIYTSSFLGTFKRMLERMKPMPGDSLLYKVHYDHFRTFIRMCAGYNTLSEFLATMTPDNKTSLMTSFIAGLEKGRDDDLEDAVDVADAFGSIRDSELAQFLQNKVKSNYELSYKERSKKGMIIYSLLARLFDGMKGSDNDSLAAQESATLGLPPINFVPYKSLLGDTNVVVEQYFFFGDEDGKISYASFLSNFKDGEWKIVTDKYWAVITSTKGKPVVIFANLPIPEPDDEEAQNKLCAFLSDNNIHPTIMVHRGHSYHLPTTIDHLSKQNKIVILGSCGGYHNLSIVLDHAPDAHIISSKQTGTMSVNEPILKALNAQLLEGNDINWIHLWRSLDNYFEHDKKHDVRDKFSDYVPPYKNLGAIFIKAYRKTMNLDNNG